MADTLPSNFPIPSSPAVASYDFQDIVDGFGYSTLYGVARLTGGDLIGSSPPTQSYSLVTLSSLAPEFQAWGAGLAPAGEGRYTVLNNGTTPEVITMDTSAYNSPRIASGTALLNFCLYNPDGGSNVIQVDAKLQKVAVGGSASDITSTVTRAWPNAATVSANMVLMALPFTADTILGVGEKTRVHLTFTCGSGDTFRFYHDPRGVDDISETRANTQMILILPTRIIN